MTKHNIILLTVDCLRYDRCSFAGHHRETTPTLDLLTRTAEIYDRAYATGMRTAESFLGSCLQGSLPILRIMRRRN